MEKLIKKYDRNPIKAEIRTLSQIKISLDDILTAYLKTVLNYKPSNIVTDIRITIGLISTILAAFVAYNSMYRGFAAYKKDVFIALVAYFLLNGIVELVMRFVDNGVVFKGRNEKGSTIRIYTSLKSADTNYIVMVYRNDKVIPEKFNKNVLDLFYENGVMLHEAFLVEIHEFFKDDSAGSK